MQVSAAFQTPLQPGKPRHQRPHRGSNRLSAQACIKGVFTSPHGPRDTLTPVGTFLSSPARSAVCKQPHGCIQPSPPLVQRARGGPPSVRGRVHTALDPARERAAPEELDTSSAGGRVIASNVSPFLEPPPLYWSQMLSGRRKRKISSRR